MRVLILEGAASRGALAAARSLAAAGWEVGVGHPSGHSLAAASSSVRRRVELPDLNDGLDDYLEAVEEHLVDGAYDLVMGAGDAEVLALSVGRNRLSARVPHPAPDILRAATDKVSLHHNALGAGLSSPPTETDIGGIDLQEWLQHGPVVVKPRLHWDAEHPGASLRIEAGLAHDRPAIRTRHQAILDAGARPLLQRYIRGRLVAYVALLDDEGSLIAHSQQQAVHTYPEPVGVSARAITELVDPDVALGSVRLLRRLGVTGLAELQFLRDDDQRYHLIDLNTRFYGSLQLAVSAGADFPRLWLDSLTAHSPKSVIPVVSRPGVRYQWLEGDVRRSMAKKNPASALGALLEATGSNHSIWSRRDPGPSRAHIRELSIRARRRLGRSS